MEEISDPKVREEQNAYLREIEQKGQVRSAGTRSTPSAALCYSLFLSPFLCPTYSSF
jgi:hypothetical protein